ncbi:MAG TPA: ABC transporter permease [Streptosporangiaceae bacterium]|nr:ABC transporter permease [Streptosporangiaceae bacterium]
MPADVVPTEASVIHPTEASVIHDLGYQRYAGVRYGRAAIARTLAGYSLRSAFGLGRSARAKIVPVGVFVLMSLPAIINAFVVARGGSRAFPYDTYSYPVRVVGMTIFIAAQAPELVSRDLRHRVLPLYFARPLRPAGYALAKLAALITACLVMLDVPLLLLYVSTIVGAHGGAAVWAQTTALLPGLALGLLWSVVLATVGLAIASSSGRRALAAGGVAAFLFLTWVLSEVLGTVATPPGHAVVASTAAKVAGLVSPFSLLDGVRQWLGGTSPGVVPDPGGTWGAGYALVLLALFAAGLAALVIRYRKAGAA